MLSAVFLSTESFRYDLPKGAIKKMDKTLANLWPEQTISKVPINLSLDSQKTLSFKLQNNSLYSILNNSKSEAYMYLSKSKSKISDFDYMVVFNPNLSILKVRVLVYREEYGGEIGSQRWLNQFIGKSKPSEMKFGDDIQNISGATISARSLTEDVRKLAKQIKELKQKGII